MAYMSGTLVLRILRKNKPRYILEAPAIHRQSLIRTYVQLTLILSSTYGPSIWLVKLAIFVLYLEVFGLLRWLRHLVFAGIFITGVFYITAMVIYIALCAPRNGHSQASYFNALASPRCSQALSLTTGVGVFNVVSDLYLILIPLPAVWSLQLPLRRKIGLAAMFLTGSMLDLRFLE